MKLFFYDGSGKNENKARGCQDKNVKVFIGVEGSYGLWARNETFLLQRYTYVLEYGWKRKNGAYRNSSSIPIFDNSLHSHPLNVFFIFCESSPKPNRSIIF